MSDSSFESGFTENCVCGCFDFSEWAKTLCEADGFAILIEARACDPLKEEVLSLDLLPPNTIIITTNKAPDSQEDEEEGD